MIPIRHAASRRTAAHRRAVLRPRRRARAAVVAAAAAMALGAPPTHAPARAAPGEALGAGAAPGAVYLPFVAAEHVVEPPPRGWGVQFALEHYPPYHDATVAADLALARANGMGTVRTFVRWDEIEPSDVAPEAYDWAATDARLAPYRDAGFELILAIVAYPPWATVYRCGFALREGRADDWREFVTALAGRYGRAPWRVALWEVGNEVDGRTTVRASDFDPVRRPPGFAPGEPTVPIGGCWGDRAAEFVAFLEIARSAVRGVDPAARLSLGGLAYAPFEDNFVPGFLDAFLAAGGGPLIEVLSLHWFGGVDYHEPSGAARVRALRAVMARHGVDRPIWLTETHRMTRHGDPESELWPVGWLTGDLVDVLAEPGVERVIWYGWRDFPDEVVAGVGQPWQRGMLRPDGSAKRALPVLAAVMRATGGRPSPLALDLGGRGAAEAGARGIGRGDRPRGWVDAPPAAVAAALFERPRAGQATVVARTRDGREARLALAVPVGRAVVVARYPAAAVRDGTAPILARPPVRGGVVEVALDGEAAFITLTAR